MGIRGLARHNGARGDHTAARSPDEPAAEAWPHVALGDPISSGRDADVFALDDDRVLRRNRSGRSTAVEASIVRHVTAHGFPAPLVFRAEGPDLEMERLQGPTLLQSLVADQTSLREAARILADLHTQLHTIPAIDLPGRPALVGECREGVDAGVEDALVRPEPGHRRARPRARRRRARAALRLGSPARLSRTAPEAGLPRSGQSVRSPSPRPRC
jgi:aminoglycoside phosphotransferase (APT) family kinase protein